MPSSSTSPRSQRARALLLVSLGLLLAPAGGGARELALPAPAAPPAPPAVLPGAPAVLPGVPAGSDATEPLRVVAAGGVPFVIDGATAPIGLSLDVWHAVARRARFGYVTTRAASVEEALQLVADQRADVAVGPISVTADRARLLSFTQPYFHAGLAILSRNQLRPGELLAPFLSRSFAAGAAFLACVLALVGTLVWLAERRTHADAFPRNPARGIANGIWFALVTMTTVGYGDLAPRTLLGRVVASVWMLIAVVSLSSLTASIATSLTLAKLTTAGIESVEQLRDQRVAAVRGTTGAQFVVSSGARRVEVSDLDAAIQLLVDGEVAAVVHDEPMLRYHLNTHAEQELSVSAQSYRTAGYAFAIGRGSPLSDQLNSSLLELAEQQRISDITDRWLLSQ